MVNEGWDCCFGDARQCVLPRLVSDHFSILLDGGGLRKDPFPFRFENMWLKVEGFSDLLKSWWEGDNFSGSSSFILVEKLKVLKAKLKEWNRDIFGKVEYRKDLVWSKWSFRMLRRRLADRPWKSWKLEKKRGKNIKNGFYFKRSRGGKNLGKCG